MNTMNKLWILALIAFGLYACEQKQEKSYSNEKVTQESKKANDFFEKSFNASLDRSPMAQGYLGIKKDNDKWDDISPKHEKQELEIKKKGTSVFERFN